MASAQVVETSVTNNSPSQDSNHPDDLFQSRYVTPGFKPFSYYLVTLKGKIFATFDFSIALLVVQSKERSILAAAGDQVTLHVLTTHEKKDTFSTK